MTTHDLDRLRSTDETVARLTRPQREDRVTQLIHESHALLDRAIRDYVIEEDRSLAGIVTLFSGGNDSSVLAHLFRGRATHAAHANTGVGVEQTRQYVRAVCTDWGLSLIERSAPDPDKNSYRALVLDQGFPGPGHHFKMYQRLKERALREIRKEIVNNPLRERVVFLAGRRRQESVRRANVPEFERQGSVVWVSPLVNWTKPDMTTYRLMMGDVPRNDVADLIHMSGECLCGSFAHEGEREEIAYWYPAAFDEIAELESLIADRPDIRDHAKKWGWGWDKPNLKKSKSGPLCQSCDSRAGGGETFAVAV